MAEYPEAPVIGGDCHEVARWLREMAAFYRDGPWVEERVAVEELLAQFVQANPEAA